MDWEAWVRRAQDFPLTLRWLPGEIEINSNVAPPLPVADALELASRLPRGLPKALYHFLTLGSANCSCSYLWTPPESMLPRLREVLPGEYSISGGASICNARELAQYQVNCQGWGEMLIGHGEACAEDSKLFLRCVPFLHMMNGDYLALDPANGDVGDPPVIYLSHEGYGQSRLISFNFIRFLMDWESLLYIGPEIWLVGLWLDSESGALNVDSERTILLRSLLLT